MNDARLAPIEGVARSLRCPNSLLMDVLCYEPIRRCPVATVTPCQTPDSLLDEAFHSGWNTGRERHIPLHDTRGTSGGRTEASIAGDGVGVEAGRSAATVAAIGPSPGDSCEVYEDIFTGNAASPALAKTGGYQLALGWLRQWK